MSATGLEYTPPVPEKARKNKGGAIASAESRSVSAQDPDLARVVDAWEHLSDTRRSMILRLLQWHEKAARSDAEPTKAPAPWVARLREAKDLGGYGTAGVALFELPSGDFEALGLDAITVADLAGLELLGDGEPWRAILPQDRLGELLPRLTGTGMMVVVVDRPTPADLAAGRKDSRRVYRPTNPEAEPDDSTEPEGGWSHGATPPALNLTEH
ncbi:MAG: hypothetical protein ACIAS6_03955 [Phycisphaerales bacterium JB060]